MRYGHDRWIFMAPGFLVLVPLIAYPTYYLINLALSQYHLARMRQPVFIGFENFIAIAKDVYFWEALKNTVLLVVSAVAIEFAVGLILALVMSEKLRAGRFFQALFLVPIMLPPIVVGLNFRLIFDSFGPLSALTQKIDWLGTPALARLAVILTDVWQWSPFVFIILLAGIRSIPSSIYDAARVDGASGWNLFRHITWPWLIPSATAALAFRLIDAFKMFDIVYMLTYGGPSSSTEVLSLYVYRTAFRFANLGYAAALAVAMLILMTIIAASVIRSMGLAKRLEWTR